MNPKKQSDIVPIVVKKTGESPDLINAVVSAYWKTVRSNLSNLTDRRFEISKFGIFKFRIENSIKHLEKLKSIKSHYLAYPKMTRAIFTRIKILDKKIEKIEALLKDRDEELAKIELKKIEKKEYEESCKNALAK